MLQVLLDFTVQFLIEQPRDLVTFALDYFTRLHQSRRGQTAPEGIRGMGVRATPGSGARGPTTNSSSLLRPDQNHSEEDDSMQSDDEIVSYGHGMYSPSLLQIVAYMRLAYCMLYHILDFRIMCTDSQKN